MRKTFMVEVEGGLDAVYSVYCQRQERVLLKELDGEDEPNFMPEEVAIEDEEIVFRGPSCLFENKEVSASLTFRRTGGAFFKILT